MAIDERRVGTKAYCWWYTTKMVWLILVAQLMAAVVSAQDPAQVRTVTYFDRFGDVVNFAYYDGEVEVKCQMVGGSCGGGNEFRLVHKTSDDTVGSKMCTGSEYTAMIRVPVRKLKFGTYSCVDKSNKTSDEDQMQFLYRGCNESEGARKCEEDRTFCIVIVDKDSVRCSKEFNTINLCDNHERPLGLRYACPAGKKLCQAIIDGKYEDAQVEEKSTPCKSGVTHIAYVDPSKLGESVQLESDKRQMTVHCPQYVADDANLTCEFKRPNGTVAPPQQKAPCGDGKVNLSQEFFAGWGVNKVECNLVKPDKSSFRLYVYLVSMFGGVRIENIKHTDDATYTKQLNCALDPQLPPAGFHNRCKFKREGTNAMDDQNNTSATKHIEEKDSGRYRCECTVTYATYTPFKKFKPVTVNSSWTMAKGKPGYKHTTIPTGPYGTGTVITTTTDFFTKYFWIVIGGAAALLAVVIIVIIVVVILCLSVDKIERVLWEADALHGKHAKATKAVEKESSGKSKSGVEGQEWKKPDLPLQTIQLIGEMDRMDVFLDTMKTKMEHNRVAAEAFWLGTLDKIMKHPGGKCHLVESLRWSRGRDANTKYKFRDPRVKDRRCLDMFEIPVMDNVHMLFGRNAQDGKNPSKDCFHLMLAFYESKTGVVVQCGEEITPGSKLERDKIYPYWILDEGGCAVWRDPDDPQRKVTVKTITMTPAVPCNFYELQVEISDGRGSWPPCKLIVVHVSTWLGHHPPDARDRTLVDMFTTILGHCREQAGKGRPAIAFMGPRTYLAQVVCAVVYLHQRLWEKRAATNLNGLLRYLARRGMNPWVVMGPDKKRWSEYGGLYTLTHYRYLWRVARVLIDIPEKIGKHESAGLVELEPSTEVLVALPSYSTFDQESHRKPPPWVKKGKGVQMMAPIGHKRGGQLCHLKRRTVHFGGTFLKQQVKHPPFGTHDQPGALGQSGTHGQPGTHGQFGAHVPPGKTHRML